MEETKAGMIPAQSSQDNNMLESAGNPSLV